MKKIVPLRIKTKEQLDICLEKIGNRADIVELWVEDIEDFENFKLPEKALFLGKCRNTEEALLFLKKGGDFVDLDIETQNIKQIPSEKLILSFHDFESMPKNLNDIFKFMNNINPFVYKFAVTPNTKKEIQLFLTFIKNFPSEKKGIFTTIGNSFGKKGREKIRETGKGWAEFFALDEKNKTAEGQPWLEKV